MKTKLLKRLRRDSERDIYPIRVEMRDMGFGRDVWRINGPIRRYAYSIAAMSEFLKRNRRDYIFCRAAELKQKRK